MNLNQIRKEINKLDGNILRLLNQRTRLALKIGKLKEAAGKEVYSPSREREVYRNLIRANKGPIPGQVIKAVYREIMSGALSLQKKLVVAYLGPEATFTHEAARTKFGSAVKYLAADSISEIFSAVEKGYADYGVVPIENSIEGAVTHTLDVFMESELKVCAEIFIEISHNLLSRENNLAKIKKIYSNRQVFAQCRSWLKTNLAKAELIEVSSTARAAKDVVRKKNSAAMASKLAAELYGLRILAADVEDVPHNVTRFLVVGRSYAGTTGKDKTSVMFSVKDRVGALYDSLKVFKLNNINLTKIESRPSKKKVWEYYFFVDFNGHCEGRNARRALKGLEKHCMFVKVLGSYPRV